MLQTLRHRCLTTVATSVARVNKVEWNHPSRPTCRGLQFFEHFLELASGVAHPVVAFDTAWEDLQGFCDLFDLVAVSYTHLTLPTTPYV